MQESTSKSDQPILVFQVHKKHLLKDRHYIAVVYQNKLHISQDAYDPNPKYKIELDLNVKIDWQFLKSSNQATPSAFGIMQKDRLKWFFASPTDLQNLRQALGNKVFNSSVVDFYIQGAVFASGSTSKVCLVIDKSNGVVQASKCISKPSNEKDNQILRESLFQEIRALQLMNHPNIINLVRIFEGKKNYYFVTEYLDGGNLNQYIYQNQGSSVIPIVSIQIIMKQILLGLQYMHSKGIMHRDIKPENIMFKMKNDINTLKIVDLGLATRWDAPSYLHPKCGTPGFVAPEIAQLQEHKQTYNNKCDVFSAGVILFKMFTRRDVFPGSTIEEVQQRNKQLLMDLSPLQKCNVPKFAQDLVLKMLQVNPDQRISVTDALNHPFFNKGKDLSNSSLHSVSMGSDATNNSLNPMQMEEEFSSLQFQFQSQPK